MSRATIHVGNVLDVLPTLAAGSVRCCVTSPPYWGLRDYGVEGQLGLEITPDAYVANMVAVFREVRRVLADDGTLWLNLGDSYGSAGGNIYRTSDINFDRPSGDRRSKNLLGIPWRVAFALQADGWYLRSDIIWAKPNRMPESVTDRPTKAHEYLFLLAKSERYYYDQEAIAEPFARERHAPGNRADVSSGHCRNDFGTDRMTAVWGKEYGRNARSVWTITTQGYKEAHYATFPEELPRRCLLAGSAPGDTVLDPFMGSGTTLAVALGNGRHGLGIELNPSYADMAQRRIGPMFCDILSTKEAA